MKEWLTGSPARRNSAYPTVKAAKKNLLPQNVLAYLSVFDLPPAKATYVGSLNGDKVKPLYQLSYRIAGRILKDNGTEFVEDVRFCHETYPYGAPGFPEPHFDIEFFSELPWVTGELRQDERACHLHYTDGKPFRQLKQFELEIFV